MIPLKKTRIFRRDYDKHIIKERNLAKRFINRINQYRHEATRYEKTARNCTGFIHLAAIIVLLLSTKRRILPRYCPNDQS